MMTVGRGRSVWVGVLVVAVFFACVTLAVAWLGGGPDVPHAVDGAEGLCVTCHPQDSLPEDHKDLAVTGCRSCHSVSPSLR